MNEAKFTKGPWRVGPISAINGNVVSLHRIECKGGLIGYGGFNSGFPDGAPGGPGPQVMNIANAHLIAAAPEMYEEMQWALDVAEGRNVGATWGDLRERFRPLLAKARGES